MPVPTALAGQQLPQLAPIPAWSATAADQVPSVPDVPVSDERPPVVTDAPSTSNNGKQNERGRKTRAVIRSTEHERIQQISLNTSYDVPLAALNAYRNAASRAASSYPGCHLSWGVVAAIGQVESGHGRFGGASVLANGVTVPKIVGPQLNGRGPVAAIRDTDNGVFDGDKTWDRAVGPMQFIPTTWVNIGLDGDGDGRRNPSDFDDAALSTAVYLCNAGGDFTSLAQARANVLRYNHSEEYVDLVLRIANAYDSGVVDVVPNDPAPPKQPRHRPARHHPGRHAPAHRPHRPAQQPPTQQPPAPKPPNDPTPPPAPKPDPPKPIDHTGTWTWVVGRTGNVKSVAYTIPEAMVPYDADGDGTSESASLELKGLTLGSVTVQTTGKAVTGFTVNKPPPPPVTPTPSPSPSPSPSATPSTAVSTTRSTAAATATATEQVAEPTSP